MGDVVEKRYVGVRRFDNARRELTCLTGLADVLPLPEVVDADPDEPRLVVRWIDGEHGQDLLNSGDAAALLRVIGETLRLVQSLPTSLVDLEGDGSVISHCDFGAQNMLFRDGRVAAIIDWESAYLGERVDDLAFAECVVRMHHADRVDYLDALFEGAGFRPPWEERQTVMLRKVEQVRQMCIADGWADAAEWWAQRAAIVERWTE